MTNEKINLMKLKLKRSDGSIFEKIVDADTSQVVCNVGQIYMPIEDYAILCKKYPDGIPNKNLYEYCSPDVEDEYILANYVDGSSDEIDIYGLVDAIHIENEEK